MRRKWRMAMVGGGKDSLIGAVHRAAARLDGRAELVAGALSSTRTKSLESGEELELPSDRVYGTYREMLRRESKLPPDQRPDFVTIVTPNNMHYPVAMAALDAGFHVVCEVPMTLTLDEALNLERKVRDTGRLFCPMHAYVAYPMVREAWRLTAGAEIGAVRRVVVEYPQGWLATRLETTGHKQAAWRTDPKRAGIAGCMGDLGYHAHYVVEYVTGLKVTEVCADLMTFVSGRLLDDDGTVLLRFNNGARGVLWASQIARGEENGLALRIYGEKGAVGWRQEDPNTLRVDWANRPTELHRTGTPFVCRAAAADTRLPAGRPEGFIEAMANVYAAFFRTLEQEASVQRRRSLRHECPTIHDGVRTLAFLDAVMCSHQSTNKWVPVEVKSHLPT